MDLKSPDRYPSNLNHCRRNFVRPSRRAGSLSSAAASWVFQKRAIGFPSRLLIERAHRRVIEDRIGGTPGELGEERHTRVRARVLIRSWNI